MPKSKPGYTLKELRTALEKTCPNHQMCAPSLISLKNWSAQGIYKRAVTIQDAVSISIERMQRNRGAYAITEGTARDAFQKANELWLLSELQKLEKRRRATSLNDCSDEDADLLDPLQRVAPQAQAPSSEPSNLADQDYGQNTSDWEAPMKESDDFQAAITRRLNGLDEQIRLLRHDMHTATQHIKHYVANANGQPSIPPEIDQAIKQLDGVRKHLMVRMNAEIEAVRLANQQAAPIAATSIRLPKDEMSAEMRIFTSQVLTRLARIESNLSKSSDR